MNEKKSTRPRWLTVRLSAEEESKLLSLQTKTTSRSLSEYARKVLLREPVTIRYRNRSADDFLFHMLALKAELNAIGINFNQAIHKLHTLDHYAEIKAWLILNESAKKAFQKKTEEILQKVNEIHNQWLPK